MPPLTSLRDFLAPPAIGALTQPGGLGRTESAHTEIPDTHLAVRLPRARRALRQLSILDWATLLPTATAEP